MITIGDILSPKHILLNLEPKARERAISKVAELLERDARVVDWDKFYAGLAPGTSCISKENGASLCIAHTRTNAVNAMIMAAGRVMQEVPGEDGAMAPRVCLIFVIGVPVALASDYLRIIGALARVFRTEKGEAALAEAAVAGEFLERLCALEMEM